MRFAVPLNGGTHTHDPASVKADAKYKKSLGCRRIGLSKLNGGKGTQRFFKTENQGEGKKNL